jgi:hypothetical protein
MIDTLLRGSGIKGAVLSTLKNVILQYQKKKKKVLELIIHIL